MTGGEKKGRSYNLIHEGKEGDALKTPSAEDSLEKREKKTNIPYR